MTISTQTTATFLTMSCNEFWDTFNQQTGEIMIKSSHIECFVCKNKLDPKFQIVCRLIIQRSHNSKLHYSGYYLYSALKLFFTSKLNKFGEHILQCSQMLSNAAKCLMFQITLNAQKNIVDCSYCSQMFIQIYQSQHCVMQPVREELKIIDDNKGKCCVGNDDFTRRAQTLVNKQVGLVGIFMKLAFYQKAKKFSCS